MIIMIISFPRRLLTNQTSQTHLIQLWYEKITCRVLRVLHMSIDLRFLCDQVHLWNITTPDWTCSVSDIGWIGPDELSLLSDIGWIGWVVLTFPWPTWVWKSSQIATISFGNHCIDPSVWFENVFHTGWNYRLFTVGLSFKGPFSFLRKSIGVGSNGHSSTYRKLYQGGFR
jgi:hypothetical protein